MKKILLTVISIVFLSLASCSSGAVAYSPYIIVQAAEDSTATPTPFQPSNQTSGVFSPQIKSQQNFPTLQPSQPSAAPLSNTPTPLPTEISNTVALSGGQPVLDTHEVTTFLLLGTDSRNGASFRTDTIMVAMVRPSDGQVSLISIPRDLWVDIPTVGQQRINTAFENGELNGYSGGGAGLLKDTILFNFGLKIDHLVMVDFDGFRKTVDTIGGIDIPISCPYTDWRLTDPNSNPEDENNWALFTAGPGIVHMNGDLALWYARSRKLSNDFDRGRRQQEVIRAIFSQVLQGNLISRIPQLYKDLSSSFISDLSLPDLLKLSPFALHLSNADIRSYYIAGDLVTEWVTDDGAQVLLPNIDPIQQMLEKAMALDPGNTKAEKIQIEIQNGSAMDGLDALAAQRLNYAGYQTSFQPADQRGHPTTLLYDLTTAQDHAKTSAILRVLGLPESARVSAPAENSKVPYVLIVGADYTACFNPAELSH